jgi:hypothetical protein
MSTKCDQCGEENPADIHTCTPTAPVPTGAAPCAKVCEANAFQITIRGLKGEIERIKAAPVQTVAWVDLLKQAEEVVRSKPLWKKYIWGTPLSNDIAVWMATFAHEHTATSPAAPPAQEPLTYEQITAISKQVAESGPEDSIDRFVRAIEQAHGITKGQP